MALANQNEDVQKQGRMQLVNAAAELLPMGVAAFDKLVECMPVKLLMQEVGVPETQTMISLLISNFCRSINVVRNMSEEQIMECTIYLLDECLDFRLEDYVMMFAMAKRGKIGNVMDHLDIEVIAEMHQEYLTRRQSHFKAARDRAYRDEMDKKAAACNPDSDVAKEALQKMREMIYRFTHLEEIADREKEQLMVESLKNNRDQQIIDLVEMYGAQGYAPEPEIMNYYLKAIGK